MNTKSKLTKITCEETHEGRRLAVTLRGGRGNVIDKVMAAELADALLERTDGPHLRCVTIAAEGDNFSFGASVPDTSRIDFAAVVLYTPVHFLVFLAFGFLSTMLVRLAARQPAVLMALVLLFVIFEVAFYVFIDAVSSELRGYFPLALVLLANLLAAIVMGIYFWRRYPELGRALRRDPLGA